MASATSTAGTTTAAPVLRGKNSIAGILTFTYIATSKVSPLVFFEALGIYKAAARGPISSVFSPVLVLSCVDIQDPS